MAHARIPDTEYAEQKYEGVWLKHKEAWANVLDRVETGDFNDWLGDNRIGLFTFIQIKKMEETRCP